MSDWMPLAIRPEASVREAIERIDAGGVQIALVVDPDRRLLGTISDGDVRRGILRGVALDSPCSGIMNASPMVARPGEDRDTLLGMMRARQLHRVPVVDERNRVLRLETFDELLRPAVRDNIVVLMAGGIGSRLRPLTEQRPKPMLLIGGRPILETILLSFIQAGFRRFYLSINYMGEVVSNYFGDGSRWGADIRYIQEPERMGTAGALGLLPEKPAAPVIVMNGDLLTKMDFPSLLDFHEAHGAVATMCVREYDFQVPYGVVRLQDHRLLSIEEKPVQRFFVNAGIYVLSPEAIAMIPPAFFDMPALFERLVSEGRETAVFPVREYWLDIGHIADLEKANGEFDAHF